MADPEAPRLQLYLQPAVALLLSIECSDRGCRDRATAEALRLATGRADIVLRRRESGRPALEAPYHELGISIARRDGLLLAGFAPDRPVGVDLELIDAIPLADGARLAADHFSRNEAHALAAMDPIAARKAFMRLWVAKEAALKISGRGIFDGLGEPDLASHIAALAADLPSILIAAGCRHPALRLTMASTKIGPSDLLCALAIPA